MVKVKKIFAWLTRNFTGTTTFLWLPIITLIDIHDEENPDTWDYSIGTFMYFTIIIILVSDIVTYRKKIAKKNL